MMCPSPKCSITYMRESTCMRMLKQYRGIWYQMETDLLDAPFDTALRPSSYPRTASMDKYNESQIASCKHLRHSITILQIEGSSSPICNIMRFPRDSFQRMTKNVLHYRFVCGCQSDIATQHQLWRGIG